MDSTVESGPPDSPSLPPRDGEPSLSSIRRILFATEIDKLKELDQEKERLESEIAALQAHLAVLQADLAAAESRLHDETTTLAAEIDDVIARRARIAPEEMAEALGPIMAGAIRVQERRAREELVDAVSPVLGEAIETQIRDSRHSIIEALYPIIGEMAARYIGEFFRELQRNIDARLKSTLGPERFARRAGARLRGVPVSELEMRDALPYSVREVFLINSGSGLLLARAGSDAAVDSDLISGMLTAVRDFMHDSFGQTEGIDPMDEIQYGEQRIIVQEGRLCYLAVVIRGIEPPGFRAELRRFITRLHADQYYTLQAFSGDMAELGEVPAAVEQLATGLVAMAPPADGSKPLTRSQKWLLGIGGLGGLLLIGLACFYLQFTLALLPVAFGDPSPTATLTITPTATSTNSPSPSATSTPTASPSNTPTSTPTFTPTSTATTSPSPTITDVPFTVVTNRVVWAFSSPDLTSERIAPLDINTPVTVILSDDPWLQVEWQSPTGPQQGWLAVRWVDLLGTPPPDFPATPEN